MKCEKPEFTEEMRGRLNTMYLLLKQRFYTKAELIEYFGLGERQIRMQLAKYHTDFP